MKPTKIVSPGQEITPGQDSRVERTKSIELASSAWKWVEADSACGGAGTASSQADEVPWRPGTSSSADM